MYLEVQGRVLPFWKPLINISKEPDCHGCCSALNVCQAMLKNCIHFSTLMHTTVLLLEFCATERFKLKFGAKEYDLEMSFLHVWKIAILMYIFLPIEVEKHKISVHRI